LDLLLGWRPGVLVTAPHRGTETKKNKGKSMTNNVFRKGLVAAAIVALGSTGLVAAPAQAASVLFAPTTGTGNTTIAGEEFSLTASLSSDLPTANGAQLVFKVTNTTGATADVRIQDGATNDALTTARTYQNGVDVSTLGNAWHTTAPAAGTSKTFARATSGSNIQAIAIKSQAATTADYTVVAFLDANNNGTVDSGELSASQTIHFVKIANAGATVAFTAPTAADAALSAKVTFGSDINVAQLPTNDYRVGFGYYATAGEETAVAASGTILNNLTGVTYDSDNNLLKSAASTNAYSGKNAAGKTFGAQLYFGLGNTGFAAVGTEVSSVVSATDSNSITQLAPATGDNVSAVSNSTTSFNIRKGTTSVALVATVKKDTSTTDATQVAVGAGVPVTWSVATNGFTIANDGTAAAVKDTITVGGKALSATATAAVTGTATTDANGKISIPVVVSGGYTGTAVTLTYALPNKGTVPNTLAGSGTVTVTWATAGNTDVTDLTVNSSTVKGSPVVRKFAITDGFGAAITTADTYQLVVTWPGVQGSSTTAPTSNSVYVPFVNGIANVSVADGSTGTGSANLSYQLQKKTDGLWSNYTSGARNSSSSVSVSVLSAAPAVAKISSLAVKQNSTDVTADLARDLDETFVAADRRVGNAAAFAPTAGSAYTVYGVAVDANGVGIANAVVTVSAAGLQFNSGSNYTVGSADVVTGANGAFSVDVYSHTAGKVTFTATSGAASKTAAVTYIKATANTTGKTLTLTAPATATPGSTVKVSALLVDKFGNPVTVTADDYFTLKVVGIGAGASTARLAADGTADVYVTLGAADAGTLTATATYNSDGATAAAPVVKTAATVVAAAKAPAAAKTALAVGADQAQVGAAVDVIATATDAAGKAAAGVVVTFDNVGQGYLSATSATTDANGVAKVKLVGNVAGRNTLTATANGATAANAGVSFGAADANITVKGKRATVTYEFAGLAKVVVSVNGTRQPAVYPADDNEGTYSFNLKAGTNKIVVSIAGKTVDSKTVKIKK
jgi:hypothetical protein